VYAPTQISPTDLLMQSDNSQVAERRIPARIPPLKSISGQACEILRTVRHRFIEYLPHAIAGQRTVPLQFLGQRHQGVPDAGDGENQPGLR